MKYCFCFIIALETRQQLNYSGIWIPVYLLVISCDDLVQLSFQS